MKAEINLSELSNYKSEGNSVIYNISNYTELNKLHLHDSRLSDISIDYNNKSIKMYVYDCENTLQEFVFHFYYFSIECFEPWGEGIYINSFTMSSQKNESGVEYISIEVLLNSGDKITIKAKEIIFPRLS